MGFSLQCRVYNCYNCTNLGESLSIVEGDHVDLAVGHKVPPHPGGQVSLEGLDRPHRQVRLGDVHHVVKVPAQGENLPEGG